MKYPHRCRATGALLVSTLLGLASPLTHPQTDALQEESVTPERLAAETCLLQEIQTAGDDVTVGMLKERCNAQAEAGDRSLLLERMRAERAAESFRFSLTPHRRNYVLPLTLVDDPNEDPFANELGEILQAEELNHAEAKFQLSLKFGLLENVLRARDRVYFGFTAQSFWQAYNRNVSAPFRETDYEPELFWVAPFDWAPFGLDAGVVTLGLSHQSNGRSSRLSRSWNRVYANIAFEKENLVVAVKPWWRIPEDEKDDPLQPDGDDNPDIEDYMGHFEFTTVYRRGAQEWSLMLRNNFDDDNYGAVQLDWTFPLWGNVRGYAQYFNGYGESLIDYNAHIERIGIGIQLSDLL